MHNYPGNWSEFVKEIDKLLRYHEPEYQNKPYLTPGLYMDGITENPKKYPLLSQEGKANRRRYISFFLKEQGRLPRGEKAKKHVWVLPEMV
jgi:hypothetical protein